ncbi:hypothetical protein EB796_006588 [Bugula neritina]|uniref:Uncharacterized protein n=1 Tax=Bugula neritina TaxID=10212 RepID=A0A7J7KA76_BUGNE|nr:hypothetical protein EB796_006588 [Bugula neritina]
MQILFLAFSLASRCQKVESDADTTSTKVNRALTTLQTNFDDLKKLETEAKDCNSQEVEEMQAMQEHLQQLKVF